MKTLVVLLFSVVLFNNCGGTDDGDNVFDVGEYTPGPVCGDGVCEAEEIGHCTVDCEHDEDVVVEAEAEDVATLPDGQVLEWCDWGFLWEHPGWTQSTCVAVAEYMWLEGKWKCAEYDNGPCPGEIIVDITIGSWDDTLGAEVHEFPPYGPPHPYLRFKKNAQTGQFEAINPETKEVVGYGTPTKVEYDSSIEVGITHHAVWEKIE